MSGPAELITAYYDAFNRAAWEEMLALLTEDVLHDINQGGRETGRPAFRRFLERMARHYQERITDLVVFVHPEGKRAAAEFMVEGRYIATDPSLPPGTPPARGQSYRLAAGAFFDLRDGRIARVTNYYNLTAWIRAIGGG
jgi:steroid delta-isomerase-like uncharacterized protein